MHFAIYVTGENVDNQMAAFEFGRNEKHEAVPIEDLLVKEGFNAKPANMLAYLTEILDKDSRIAIVEPDAISDEYTLRHLYLADMDRIVTYDPIKRQWLALLRIDQSSEGRWDWYVVGGRWRDCLKAKPGIEGFRDTTLDMMDNLLPWSTEDRKGRREGWYASLLKSEIDWEGMEQDHMDALLPRYDDFHKWYAENPVVPYKEFCAARGLTEESDHKDWVAASSEYNGLPLVQAANKLFGYGWADLVVPRDVYIQYIKYSSRHFFGYLHQGVWTERDTYGWFGNGQLLPEVIEYYEKAEEWLNSLPPDTRLTVVDYHC